MGLLTLWAIPAATQSYDYAPGTGYRSLTPVTRPVADGEGRGVRLGDFRLHPGMSLSGGYISNVFYEEELEGVEESSVLHLMPSLRLVTPNPRTLRLSANTQLLWELYPSGEDTISSQSGIDILGDVSAQLAPRGIVSFAIYDVIRRYMDSPTTPDLETRDHFYNEVGTQIAFHPGGSDRTSRRGFTASLTGGYGIEVWDDDLSLDRNIILARLEVKYFFLPKTALSLRASLRDIAYASRERPVELEGAPELLELEEAFQGSLVNIDSTPYQVMLGVSGLLTRFMDFGLEGGIGFSNYAEGPNYEDEANWLASAHIGVFFNPDAHMMVGWEHGFTDSSFSNFYKYDRFVARLDVSAGDFLVGANVGFELQQYASLPVPFVALGGTLVPLYSTANREDPVLSTSAFVCWNFTEWARLTTYYNLRANLTDFVITTGVPSGPGRPNSQASQYVRHEVFLATEFEY